VLQARDHIPDAVVWVAPQEQASLGELVAERPALFFFYLFDWSKRGLDRIMAR
jgi:hypothetical protein